jgi:hypothetical protein
MQNHQDSFTWCIFGSAKLLGRSKIIRINSGGVYLDLLNYEEEAKQIKTNSVGAYLDQLNNK